MRARSSGSIRRCGGSGVVPPKVRCYQVVVVNDEVGAAPRFTLGDVQTKAVDIAAEHGAPSKERYEPCEAWWTRFRHTVDAVTGDLVLAIDVDDQVQVAPQLGT